MTDIAKLARMIAEIIDPAAFDPLVRMDHELRAEEQMTALNKAVTIIYLITQEPDQ